MPATLQIPESWVEDLVTSTVARIRRMRRTKARLFEDFFLITARTYDRTRDQIVLYWAVMCDNESRWAGAGEFTLTNTTVYECDQAVRPEYRRRRLYPAVLAHLRKTFPSRVFESDLSHSPNMRRVWERLGASIPSNFGRCRLPPLIHHSQRLEQK